jgi:hypothetical protein
MERTPMKIQLRQSLAVVTMAASLALPTPFALAQYGAPAQPYYQAWDAPPAEFREIQRQGFHDGVEGARKDYDNHRYPNVNNRAEYRHPHVPPSARDDYREGFRRGYDVAMNHLLHGAPPR